MALVTRLAPPLHMAIRAAKHRARPDRDDGGRLREDMTITPGC